MEGPGRANPGLEGRSRKLRPGRRSLLRLERFEQGDKEGTMNKLVQFVKESYAELRKVIWPSRDDVISSVKVVLVSTVIIAAILGLVDVLLLLGVQAIF
jgi:preprotein translocase subunit SecE